MIPVIQSKVVVRNSKNEIIVNGNCWAAAIASILELPLTEIPNFEVWFQFPDYSFYFDLTERFLIRKGYTIEYAPFFKVFHPEILEDEIKNGDFNYDIENIKKEYENEYYFICGQSVRGVQHVTIWQNGKMVHDPHPTGEGIQKLEHFEYIRKLNEDEIKISKDFQNFRNIRFPIIKI